MRSAEDSPSPSCDMACRRLPIVPIWPHSIRSMVPQVHSIRSMRATGEVVPQSKNCERVGVKLFPEGGVKLLKEVNCEVLKASRHREREAVMASFRQMGYEEMDGVDSLGCPLIRLDPDDLLNSMFRFAERGQVTELRPLLDVAAQRFAREYDGENLLSFAVAANQPNVVALIMSHRYTRYLATDPDRDGDTPLSCVQLGRLARSGVSPADQALLLKLLTCSMDDPALAAASRRQPNRNSKGMLNFGSTTPYP